jgi:hypothetical protein
MSDDLKVRESSGNVFQDLGAREAEERLAKGSVRTPDFDFFWNTSSTYTVPPSPKGRAPFGVSPYWASSSAEPKTSLTSSGMACRSR